MLSLFPRMLLPFGTGVDVVPRTPSPFPLFLLPPGAVSSGPQLMLRIYINIQLHSHTISDGEMITPAQTSSRKLTSVPSTAEITYKWVRRRNRYGWNYPENLLQFHNPTTRQSGHSLRRRPRGPNFQVNADQLFHGKIYICWDLRYRREHRRERSKLNCHPWSLA